MFRYPNRCLLILNLFYRQMSILTMSIIAKCAFGMTIENLGEKDNPLLEKARALFSPPEAKTPLGAVACKKISIFTYSKTKIISIHEWKSPLQF